MHIGGEVDIYLQTQGVPTGLALSGIVGRIVHGLLEDKHGISDGSEWDDLLLLSFISCYRLFEAVTTPPQAFLPASQQLLLLPPLQTSYLCVITHPAGLSC